MKASFWVGLVASVFLLLFGRSWYRERQRAQRAIAAEEQMALELESRRQSKTSLDQSRAGHGELTPEAISPSTGNDSKSTTPSNSSSSDVNPALLLPNVKTKAVTNLEDAHVFSATSVTSGDADKSLPYTEQQLEIYRCCNQMCEINIAAERWAFDHNGLIPPNLMELRGYLAPMLLICPGSRPSALSAAWEQFKPEDISYQVSPSSSGKQWDFQVQGQARPVTVIWLRCSIHKKLSTDNRIRFGGIPVSQEFRAR